MSHDGPSSGGGMGTQVGTLSIAGAQSVLSPEAGFDVAAIGTIAWELIGALVAGALLGLLIDLYLRRVGTRLVIFVIFVCVQY